MRAGAPSSSALSYARDWLFYGVGRNQTGVARSSTLLWWLARCGWVAAVESGEPSAVAAAGRPAAGLLAAVPRGGAGSPLACRFLRARHGRAANRPRSNPARAHDSRRQRQDNVGFLRLAARVGEQPAHERNVAQSRNALQHLTLVVPDETSEQVGLAVLKADHRVDFTVAERRQSPETSPGNAADQDLQR